MYYIPFIVLTIAYFSYFSLRGLKHREMNIASNTIKEIGSELQRADYLIVLTSSYSPHISKLLLPLRYYYGVNVIYSSLSDLSRYIEAFSRDTLYIVSNENIEDMGQEIVFQKKFVSEEFKSTRFIPIHTEITDQEKDLLLLRYKNDSRKEYTRSLSIIPRNYIRSGFYEDNWTTGQATIFNVNILMEKMSRIVLKAKESSLQPTNVTIVIDDSRVTLEKTENGDFLGYFQTFEPILVDDLRIDV